MGSTARCIVCVRRIRGVVERHVGCGWVHAGVERGGMQLGGAVQASVRSPQVQQAVGGVSVVPVAIGHGAGLAGVERAGGDLDVMLSEHSTDRLDPETGTLAIPTRSAYLGGDHETGEPPDHASQGRTSVEASLVLLVRSEPPPDPVRFTPRRPLQLHPHRARRPPSNAPSDSEEHQRPRCLTPNPVPILLDPRSAHDI